jgi:3-oxoadipate enol-lactonase
VTGTLRDVGGKPLFVEDSGTLGPTVVLVHGLGGTTSFYEPLMPALTREFRVLRYDFDGHGRSPLTGPVTVPEMAADLGRLVSDLVGSPARIVAHSMGTLITQHLAASAPELVERLVLLGPVRAQVPAARDATRARAATVRTSGMAAVADTIAIGATSPAARAANPLVTAVVRGLLRGQQDEGYARACEALAAAEDVELSQIAARVLLLTGADDTVSPPPANDALAAELKDATVAVAENCGHWTVTEAPDVVATHTLRFLTS